MYSIFNSEKQIFRPALKFIASKGFAKANSQQFNNRIEETLSSRNILIFLTSKMKDGFTAGIWTKNLKSKSWIKITVSQLWKISKVYLKWNPLGTKQDSSSTKNSWLEDTMLHCRKWNFSQSTTWLFFLNKSIIFSYKSSLIW